MGALGFNLLSMTNGVGEVPDVVGDKYDSDIVSDGGFADGTGWTTGAGWSIAAGVLTGAAGEVSKTLQSGITVATVGTTYRVSLEITAVSAGGVRLEYGGGFTTEFNTVGVHAQEITAASTVVLEIYKNAAFIGSVDNVSVREVIR